MMTPDPADADTKRGIGYADGGVADLMVYWPDPEKVQACHDEWEEEDAS